MRGSVFQRFFCIVLAFVLGTWTLPVVAQTPESDVGIPEGQGVVAMPAQRDLVVASNADALIYGDYPRLDIAVEAEDLSCFRLNESREYGERQGMTLELTWCLNARNGLVTATSTTRVFGTQIVVQGAFCGWILTTGEREIDAVICRTLIHKEPCGPAAGACHDDVIVSLGSDGTWAMVVEPIDAWSYDASLPYPMSG